MSEQAFERKRPLCRTICGWENNVKIPLKHNRDNVDFIHVAQDIGQRRSFAKTVPKLVFDNRKIDL